MFANNN